MARVLTVDHLFAIAGIRPLVGDSVPAAATSATVVTAATVRVGDVLSGVLAVDHLFAVTRVRPFVSDPISAAAVSAVVTTSAVGVVDVLARVNTVDHSFAVTGIRPLVSDATVGAGVVGVGIITSMIAAVVTGHAPGDVDGESVIAPETTADVEVQTAVRTQRSQHLAAQCVAGSLDVVRADDAARARVRHFEAVAAVGVNVVELNRQISVVCLVESDRAAAVIKVDGAAELLASLSEGGGRGQSKGKGKDLLEHGGILSEGGLGWDRRVP